MLTATEKMRELDRVPNAPPQKKNRVNDDKGSVAGYGNRTEVGDACMYVL